MHLPIKNQHDAHDGHAPAPCIQVAENVRMKPVRVRVKPQHLSPVVRQLIVDRFQVQQSSEDLAESFGLPVGTVRDVILFTALMRKGPASENFAHSGIRRIA